VSIVAPDNSIIGNFLAFGATVKNLWVPGKVRFLCPTKICLHYNI